MVPKDLSGCPHGVSPCPCLTPIAFLEARLRTGETRSTFGKKGGWTWWFLYLILGKGKYLGLKNKRNHQPTSVYPLRTSAERICTEPPATTRLANSCGSSGLHTWFDLKMGYTLPETASWVEAMKINHENWVYLETSPNTSNACSPEPELMHQYPSLPRLKGIRVLRVATHCGKKGTKCEWCQ